MAIEDLVLPAAAGQAAGTGTGFTGLLRNLNRTRLGRAGLYGVGGSLLGEAIEGQGTNDTWRDVVGDIVRGAGFGSTFGVPGAIAGAAGGLATGLLDYFNVPGFSWMDQKPKASVSDLMSRLPQPKSGLDVLAANREKLFSAGPRPTPLNTAAGLNASEMQALSDYWRNLQTYGQNRAQALNQMFSGLAAATARGGEREQRQGTQLAADIENLYSNLGRNMAEAQAGNVVASPTAGLAPVSGVAATAPVEAEAVGATLSDYLSRAAGAQAQNIYDIAGAQAAQGAGLYQGFLDTLAMAENQQRAAAQIAAANRAAQEQALNAQRMDAWRARQSELDRQYAQAALLMQQQEESQLRPSVIARGMEIIGTETDLGKQLDKLIKAADRGEFDYADIEPFLGRSIGQMGA